MYSVRLKQSAGKHVSNIGMQGVQELFFVNNKSLKVVNNACQSMVLPVWSIKSDWSVKP